MTAETKTFERTSDMDIPKMRHYLARDPRGGWDFNRSMCGIRKPAKNPGRTGHVDCVVCVDLWNTTGGYV